MIFEFMPFIFIVMLVVAGIVFFATTKKFKSIGKKADVLVNGK